MKFFIVFVVVSFSLGAVFTPISEADYNKTKALLGKELFFDERLSDSGHSCQSCHHLKGELTGVAKDKLIPYSILNSSLTYYIDDKRVFRSLKDQIKNDFNSQNAYNTKPSHYVNKIYQNPKYVKKFKEIYGHLTFESAVDALNEFIYALRSPARFDDYLLGDEDAMNEQEKEGFRVFLTSGCAACHNGANLGGGMAAKLQVDNNETYAKVPSLRNVTRTGPWLKFKKDNLVEAIILVKIRFLDTNVQISKEDIEKIIVFFEALNSKVPSILQE